MMVEYYQRVSWCHATACPGNGPVCGEQVREYPCDRLLETLLHHAGVGKITRDLTARHGEVRRSVVLMFC